MPKTVLPTLAVLKLCVQSQKFSRAVLVVKTKDIMLVSQDVLIFCVQRLNISTAVLIVHATTCAGCSSLESFARTPDKN